MDDLKSIIGKVATGATLSRDEAATAFDAMMSGEATPSQMGGLLMALRVRGETVDEITGAVAAMRGKMLKVQAPADAIDVVGTGGDGSGSVNVSTCAAFIVAGSGVPVAKHGNRALSSRSGSADVLASLGVKIDLAPDGVGRCVKEAGIGFMFAPAHHAAMKHAAPVRRELGVRTIFNILGPLTNPAGAQMQVMGVFHPDLVGIQIRVLQRLGAHRAMTFYGLEGLDEISVSGQTMIGELKEGKIVEYLVHPERFGLPVHDPRGLRVASVEESRKLVVAALENASGPARDIVALNAGAAIYVGGQAPSFEEGVEKAFDLIKSGAARAKLEAFVKFTQQLARG
jgi:anthranilate phosphoribosyltransferase